MNDTQVHVPDGFRAFSISCFDGPDFKFAGRILGHTESRPGKPRRTRYRIYETPAGNFVAETVAVSDIAGEIDQHRAWTCKDRWEVMEAFAWALPAKKLAKSIGWDVIERPR